MWSVKDLKLGGVPDPQQPSIGAMLKHHPFSGLADSASELLHTP